MKLHGQPIHFSIAALMLRIGVAIFLVETAYVLALAVCIAVAPPVDVPTVVLILWGIQTVKFLILAFIVEQIIAAWAGQSAYVYENMLTIHSGIVTAEDKVLELSQLRSVSRQQGFLGRLLNFGTLVLNFGRYDHPQNFFLYNVHNPKHYQDIFSDAIAAEHPVPTLTYQDVTSGHS